MKYLSLFLLLTSCSISLDTEWEDLKSNHNCRDWAVERNFYNAHGCPRSDQSLEFKIVGTVTWIVCKCTNAPSSKPPMTPSPESVK